MLCKSAENPFDNELWAFEIKWDGYRAIADLRNRDQKLYSRNSVDFSAKFKNVMSSLIAQEHEMILDGEIVAYDESGKPNFQALQNIEESPQTTVIYQVFDLLWLNGLSTEHLEYQQRKELLKRALKQDEFIQYHDYIKESGMEFFKLIKDMQLEGIIAKKLDSLYYEDTRSNEWLKIKVMQTDELIIGGFTHPKGNRKYFGSLILGKYVKGELKFCGHTGTGFSTETLRKVHQKLKPLIIEDSPFKKTPLTNDTPTWVKPLLIAEIKYSKLTNDRLYRHPVFLRLREDLDSENIRFD
ncbi:non-homologous end-joining DNA ligase [Elizabethkingia occulta]|uniref:non-homologous end-joining DNA ligase n=1 Tax=Elizabethkingia occulta TaxID=1867263 RepID=UPI0021A7723E|nr:non-homologous end-joining DNA ligase [Elizabethkingia occulta]